LREGGEERGGEREGRDARRGERQWRSDRGADGAVAPSGTF